MITISVERGLVRLKSWEDMLETPGFNRDIDPKHVQLKEIIGVYAFDTKQPCGLKSCRQPHGNGYLVTTTDGQVTNIGNVCGRKNFSIAFIQLQKVFDKDFRAKERRERLESLKSRMPSIIGRIEELKSEATPLYTAIRHLSGDSGSFPRAIVEAVRNMRRAGDGAVIVSRKSTQAERERAIATGNARQGTPYYVSETIGRLSNIGAVSGASTLRSALSEIEPALRRLEVADIDSISDKDARNIDRVTTGLDSQLDRLRQLVDSAKAFVTRSNLSQMEAILENQTDKKLFSAFLNSLPTT
jgi:hypothetical protein